MHLEVDRKAPQTYKERTGLRLLLRHPLLYGGSRAPTVVRGKTELPFSERQYFHSEMQLVCTDYISNLHIKVIE